MRPHIAVVGGGYAGIMALGRLRMQEPLARLTLVDPGTHFEARIHLHQVAAGGSAPHVSYSKLCEAWKAEHLRARLTRIDGRRLTLEKGTLEPDAVILTLGSRSRRPPGPAYVLDDQASAGDLAVALEQAERVTVVGAGTTALETVTALATRHPRLQLTLWRSGAWGANADVVEGRLADLGVQVVVGGRVRGLDAETCWSGTHTRGHDVAIWCAGFEPCVVPGLVAGHPDGRVAVDACLHLGDGVFAAGDLAASTRAYRTGCVTAIPMGAHAALNASRWLRGEDLVGFRFQDTLSCVDLGGGHGLASFLDAEGRPTSELSGRLGGLTKAGIFLYVRGSYAAERSLGRPLYSWAKDADLPWLEHPTP